MKQVFNKILIFDGSHALHRALCQPELWAMKTSKGKRTGGILGTLRTIFKESKSYNYFPVVVFDGGLSERRLKLYPNYKHTLDKQLLRESNEPLTEEQLIDEEYRREYNTQRNDLIQLLPLFGIPVVYSNGWEGDDLIYILTKLSKNSIVVSDDKDLLQLIHQPDSNDDRLCRVRRGMRDEFWDYNTLQEKDLNITEYICCKSIVGDASDNIPSACFQVGEKTAPTLYKLYSKLTENNIQFPQDEEQLEKVCKQFDIPKRKAFLNFNEAQFMTNLLLTDLSLVDNDITDDLVNNIYNSVIQQSQYSDSQHITTMMDAYEIRTFETLALLVRVESLIEMLDIVNQEKVKEISDQNRATNCLFKI